MSGAYALIVHQASWALPITISIEVARVDFDCRLFLRQLRTGESKRVRQGIVHEEGYIR